jgi:putative chitinase
MPSTFRRGPSTAPNPGATEEESKMAAELTYERKYFFDNVRASLFRGSLSQSQVDGLNYLLGVWERHFAHGDPRHLAYCLATAYHETAQTMRPIEEYGKGKGYKYGQPAGPHGQIYYGRGHVQLTWEDNYKRATEKLRSWGVHKDLHRHAHLALEDEVSALVLYDGMSHGWFTGKKLGDYFHATREDPREARRIVNRTDKQDLIAGYYWKFKGALQPIAEEAPERNEGPQMPEPTA